MEWLGILIVIVIIAFIGSYIYFGDGIAKFTVGIASDKVSFLSKSETAAFLKADPDRYISLLTTPDLVARGVGTHSAYIDKASAAAADYSMKEKMYLVECALDADASMTVTCPGFAIRLAQQIPWVFAKTEGKEYEAGLPHTRANVVFITGEQLAGPKESVVETLMHEKVHLYQRLYPDGTAAYIKSKGFLLWKQRDSEPLIRANPDVDPYIYIDPVTKGPMGAYYSSEKPKSITDVTYTPINQPMYEHPFELMAYELQGPGPVPRPLRGAAPLEINGD